MTETNLGDGIFLVLSDLILVGILAVIIVGLGVLLYRHLKRH